MSLTKRAFEKYKPQGLFLEFYGIFKIMQTMRKQFLVNWLTSGGLAFMIQGAKARRSQQMKEKAA